MTVLILGANGQMGSVLYKMMPDSIALARKDLDVSQAHILKAKLEEIQPDLIFNCAAMTNVDGCEKEKEMAYKTNSIAPYIISQFCMKSGARIVHFSTDYVFDGLKGMYREEDTPNPINYYGISKLMGDFSILPLTKSLIIRTSGVFGEKMNFPGFVYRNLIEGKQVNAIDSFYSPIHVFNLAKVSLELANNGISGIINVSGERTSRYDLAIKIAQFFDLDENLIQRTSAINKEIARRPKDSSLDITRAKKIINWDFYSINSNISLLDRNWNP